MERDFEIALGFAKAHPLEATRVLERLKRDEIASFLANLPAEISATILRLMDLSAATQSLIDLGPNKAGSIMECLPVELASLHLQRMESDARDSILNEVQPETAKGLRSRLAYPEGTCGALMNPKAMAVPQDIRVQDALERIRQHPENAASRVYVVDREQVLIGSVTPLDLLLSDPQAEVATLTKTGLQWLRANMRLVSILASSAWSEFYELPVVDEKGVFLGTMEYRMLQRLVQDFREKDREEPVGAAGKALGELYWISISGFFKSVASALERQGKPGQ
jgi:Mg/Co/Ni transporter MgtE